MPGIAPATDYEVHRFGHEAEPIVVIDGFSGWSDGLAANAKDAAFEAVSGYPGIRAAINPRDYVAQSDKASVLARALREQFAFDGKVRFESCCFSIVTVQPDQLAPQQRIPHFDEARAHVVAIVHYIRAQPESGTAFYRHRRSGFEAITPDRLREYEVNKAADDAEFGAIPARYQRGNCERYELIGQISARPDRLIAYRGRQLHSGNIIGAVPAPSRAVHDGRLTVTGFILGEWKR